MEKVTTFSLISAEWVEAESLEKSAALKSLPPNFVPRPGFQYLWLRAVSAGEFWGPNKNADFFEESELRRAYPTFVSDAHGFTNHDNKDAAKAIGRVIIAEWDDAMKCVLLLEEIDPQVAPTVVRNLQTGVLTDFSMGCRVKYTICSICGNRASNRQQFCVHVLRQRGQIYPDGRRVYEINREPRFHDISVVLSGADRTAKRVAIHPMVPLEKAAASAPPLDPSWTPAVQESADWERLASALMPKQRRHAFLDKLADFEKALEGRILGVAAGRQARIGAEHAPEILRFIEFRATPHLSMTTMHDMGRDLAQGAREQRVAIPDAIQALLHHAGGAGVEWTPSELIGLLHGVYSQPVPPERDQVPPGMTEDPARLDAWLDRYPSPAFAALPWGHRVQVASPDRIPAPFWEVLDGLLAPHLSQRSVLLPFPAIRWVQGARPSGPLGAPWAPLVEDAPRPGEDPRLWALAKALWAHWHATPENWDAWEPSVRERTALVDNTGWEKTAAPWMTPGKYTLMKRIFMGTPAVLGYSAIQRARQEQGGNLNAFNQAMANYPQIFVGANIALGGHLADAAAHGEARLRAEGRKVVDAAKPLRKSAPALVEAEEKVKKSPLRTFFHRAAVWNEWMGKYAADPLVLLAEESQLTAPEHVSLTIFDDPGFGERMAAQFGAAPSIWLKHAAILTLAGEGAAAEHAVEKSGQPWESVGTWIEAAVNYTQEQLVKSATLAPFLLTNGLFTSRGATLATLPGVLATSLLMNHLENNVEKKALPKPAKDSSSPTTSPVPSANIPVSHRSV